ncbi:MAG: hypothetical protein ISR65_01355 [Bacteriovoracaceae bacterium]|nr:hypothetical protein [Bacteriovoracaceae bacterium]
MKSVVKDDYHKAMDSLEDLYQLADSSVIPIINRAFFYLGEIKDKSENEFIFEQKYEHIANFLESSVSKMISSFLMKNYGSKKIFHKQNGTISFKKWNVLLNVLPTVFSIINLIKYESRISLVLSEKWIEIKGDIGINFNLQSLRHKISDLLVVLFKNNIPVTYKLDETESTSFYEMSLFIDITHDENLHYIVDMKEELGLYLAFSNTFSNYSLSDLNDQRLLVKHLCIEINENATISKYDFFPKRYCRATLDKDIFYFNFLFRPVSLIISKKGKIFPADVLRDFGDTGSESSNYQKDDASSHGEQVKYIDFFDLIS